MRAFRNSLLFAGGAALMLALGVIPMAVRLERFDKRWRRVLGGIVDLPYTIPGVVLAIACILLFLRPLPLIGSLYATASIILVAYAMRFLTLALKPVTTAVGQIPRDLDEAAAVSRARPLWRLRTLPTPLLAPPAMDAAGRLTADP